MKTFSLFSVLGAFALLFAVSLGHGNYGGSYYPWCFCLYDYVYDGVCKQTCCSQRNCELKPDPGLGYAYMPSWYYDPYYGTCRRFIYGGSDGNRNRFSTYERCMYTCAYGPY